MSPALPAPAAPRDRGGRAAQVRGAKLALLRTISKAATISPEQVHRGYSGADLAIFDLFAGQPKPSLAKCYATNFFGARTRASLIRGVGIKGVVVLGMLVPKDNWHSDAIEWVGVLRSAGAVPGPLAAMEIGAGWGPYGADSATATRLLGVATHDAKLHGDLMDLIFHRGRALEDEKPPSLPGRTGCHR